MIAIVAAAVSLAAYAWAFRAYHRRFPSKPAPVTRPLFFALGCTVLAVAFGPPLDALAERSFAWHMAQHMAVVLIAAPMLLLGAPLLYVLGNLPHASARAVCRALRSQPCHAMLAPVPAWLLFVAVLWVSHFSPLYDAAVRSEPIHVFEHALYFGSALLFWNAVVQTGFVPHPVVFPARMAYVFVAIPQGAFLGLALYQTRNVLYPSYAAGHSLAWVLADQHDAGALMWIGGGLLFFTAFMITAAMWAARERTPDLGYVTK